MTLRAELLTDRTRLFEARAESEEARALAQIAEKLFSKGLGQSSVFVEQRYERRLSTVHDVLVERLKLEREQPLGPEDASSWYDSLVANFSNITGSAKQRLLTTAESEWGKSFGAALPVTHRAQFEQQIERLEQQYLEEARLLRKERRLPHRPPGTTMVTINISQSQVANLNLGTQVGHIQDTVGGLQATGLQDVADAIRQLTEGIVNESVLSAAAKREAVELVSSVSEEIAKPDAERRGSVLRMAGRGLWEVVKNVDKFRVPYEIVRGAAQSQGIELPPWPGA